MRNPSSFIRSAYSSAVAARAAATPVVSAASTCTPQTLLTVPTISLSDLRSPSDETATAVRDAFIGRSSFGSISVRCPGFNAVRRKALASGSWLALDPSAAQARHSCHKTDLGDRARVQPGWSGSPGNEEHPIQSGFYCNLREQMSQSCQSDDVFGCNMWPNDIIEESKCTEFKEVLLEAGETMHEVTCLVLELARDAARSEAEVRGLGVNDYEHITTQSKSFLPLRLTYYDANHKRKDSLTGDDYLLPWHIDFNLATAFVSAEWFDEESALHGDGTNIQIRGSNDNLKNPEKEAGLLLRNSNGDVIPASIDEDCILIQLGAYAQLASGGLLRAGPHAVGLQKGQQDSHQGRLTLGLFTYAPWNSRMLPPSEGDEEAVLKDDFGGLMKRSYTGDTVLAGFESFAKHMNTPRDE